MVMVLKSLIMEASMRLPYKHRYDINSVVVREIITTPDGKTWLFYQPPVESPYYSPGIEVMRDGDDLRISVLRVSVEDGKTWEPGAGQVGGLRQWEWTEMVGEQSWPHEIGKKQYVVIAKLPIRPKRVFLCNERDAKLAWSGKL
jgi:hypothetical protein